MSRRGRPSEQKGPLPDFAELSPEIDGCISREWLVDTGNGLLLQKQGVRGQNQNHVFQEDIYTYFNK